MKICSGCRNCYDDSVSVCSSDTGVLVQDRAGNCSVVKGYQIDSRLTKNSPADIYKATHSASGKSVRVGFIETKNIDAENLQRELQTAAGINHPHLARVYEFGKISDDEFYVVSEDIEGENLREYLEKNAPLKEKTAIKIARQIAEGLEAIHHAGLIHQAVSPANICFTSSDSGDSSVKLQNYDFGGIVRKFVVEGANGIDAETEIMRYFSPEQFTNEIVDFKTDIYSLAVVFYEMLLGRSPYCSINPQAISNYGFNENDVDKLHFELRALLAYNLSQSLQHRPELRPPTTNNLARQFRHLELVAAPHEIEFREPKPILNVKPVHSVKRETNAELPHIETEKPRVEIIETKTNGAEAEAKIGHKPPIEVIAFNVPIQSETESIANIENADFEFGFQEDFGQFSDDVEVSKFETAQSAEIFENIHITDKNTDNFFDGEEYFDETSAYPETEFIENDSSQKPGYQTDFFGAYSQNAGSSRNTTYGYIAGVFALVIFAGVLVSSVSNNENEIASGEKESVSIQPIQNTISENAKIPQTGSIQTIAEVAEDFDNIQPQSNDLELKKIPEPAVRSDYKTNRKADDKPDLPSYADKRIEKPVEPATIKKESKVLPVKKEVKAVLQPKKVEIITIKNNSEKPEKTVRVSNGMIRPRIVANTGLHN